MTFSVSGLARHSYSAPGTPGVETRTFRYAEAAPLADFIGVVGYFADLLEGNQFGQVRPYIDEITLQGQNPVAVPPAPPILPVVQVSAAGHLDANGTFVPN